MAYSALEFLAIKSLMEMKKTLDKVSSGAGVSGTQSPGLMPGMGQPGTMPGMMLVLDLELQKTLLVLHLP